MLLTELKLPAVSPLGTRDRIPDAYRSTGHSAPRLSSEAVAPRNPEPQDAELAGSWVGHESRSSETSLSYMGGNGGQQEGIFQKWKLIPLSTGILVSWCVYVYGCYTYIVSKGLAIF